MPKPEQNVFKPYTVIKEKDGSYTAYPVDGYFTRLNIQDKSVQVFKGNGNKSELVKTHKDYYSIQRRNVLVRNDGVILAEKEPDQFGNPLETGYWMMYQFSTKLGMLTTKE